MQLKSRGALALVCALFAVLLAVVAFPGLSRLTVGADAPSAVVRSNTTVVQKALLPEADLEDQVSEKTRRLAERPLELIRQAAAPSQGLVDVISDGFKVDPRTAREIVEHAMVVASEERLPLSLLLAVIARESSFNPTAVNNRDVGLMQVNLYWHSDKIVAAGGPEAMFAPDVNIRLGARILKEYVSAAGSYHGGLRRYNGLDKANNYPEEVLAFMRAFQSAL